MPLFDYYERFFLQAWELYSDPLTDEARRFCDSAEVFGFFAQNTSPIVRKMEAETVSSLGKFLAGENTPVCLGDVLRRERDGVYIKITSVPQKAPAPALSRPISMNAEVISPI